MPSNSMNLLTVWTGIPWVRSRLVLHYHPVKGRPTMTPGDPPLPVSVLPSDPPHLLMAQIPQEDMAPVILETRLRLPCVPNPPLYTSPLIHCPVISRLLKVISPAATLLQTYGFTSRPAGKQAPLSVDLASHQFGPLHRVDRQMHPSSGNQIMMLRPDLQPSQHRRRRNQMEKITFGRLTGMQSLAI